MIGVAGGTEEIVRGSRVLMITQQAFYNGEFDFPSSILFLLVGSGVSAGFPSPADDYIETSIDLNRELVRHPFATFFVRAKGNSMVDAGIKPNATLVVDRAIETKSGDVVIARIGDEMCVKELFIDDGEAIAMEQKLTIFPKTS